MSKKFLVMFLAVYVLILTGCKPYQKELYQEVKSYQTAFAVPLENDVSKQKKFNSVEAVKNMQVARKRIPIPTRWYQSGRLWFSGEWIPVIDVILVDRSPATREWIADSDKGSNRKDDGLWMESNDSVGFSTGFTCTAQIKDENAALFLYNYPNSSLDDIMDNQVRAEIQAVASQVAAQYDMDELRGKKTEIIDAVEERLVPFFASTGITITTIGNFGGFSYENPEIQKAIDDVFVAQQEKEVTKAQLEAQKDKNLRIEKEAEAFRNAAITKAEGEAASVKLKAQAEAESVLMISEAASKANENPVFLELKKLEVQMRKAETWDGKLPTHIWTNGDTSGGMGIILNSKDIQ